MLALLLLLSACTTVATVAPLPSDTALFGDTDADTAAPPAPPVGSVSATAPSAAEPDCQPAEALVDGQVTTLHATYSGVRVDDVWSWRGIAYAAPPVGELRWRPPEPPPCESDPVVALFDSPACPQIEGGALIGDEDCLSLNIWAPADAEGPLPVLFFVHGGSHVRGANSVHEFGVSVYDGASLARRGAVVVTVNYRLGALGWLVHDDLAAESAVGAVGNYGLADQAAALAWVRDNIAAFGGDPLRVHGFGQSAGAVDLCAQVASPAAQGLLAGVTLMSGNCALTADPDLADETGRAVFAALGCAGDGALDCARAASTEALFGALVELGAHDQQGAWLPYVDGVALDDVPDAVFARGEHDPMPIEVSNTAEEWRSFWPTTDTTEQGYIDIVMTLPDGMGPAALERYPLRDYASPDEALIALVGDYSYLCPSRRTLRALEAGQDAPLWRALFDVTFSQPVLAPYGAGHSVDLYFVFDHVAELGGDFGEQQLAAEMQDWLVQLAATGAPDGDGPALWTAYDGADDNHMVFADPPGMEGGLRAEFCDFWDGLVE